MRFVKQRAGWKKTLTLSEACQQFRIEPGTHRAATDARATAALLRQLLLN
jgi:DNA polymerase III epsilon subunit-like protein